MNSPAVSIPAGTLVRISAWIRVPEAIKASADGALFYDNIGGEPLSVRLTEQQDWKQYTFAMLLFSLGLRRWLPGGIARETRTGRCLFSVLITNPGRTLDDAPLPRRDGQTGREHS